MNSPKVNITITANIVCEKTGQMETIQNMLNALSKKGATVSSLNAFPYYDEPRGLNGSIVGQGLQGINQLFKDA